LAGQYLDTAPADLAFNFGLLHERDSFAAPDWE